MIVDMETDAGPDLIGGKAAALARLASAGFPVPEFFALTPAACVASRIDDAVPSAPSVEVRSLIDKALADLGPGPYAVRSSAVDEDGAGHSFAGQLESYLFVDREKVAPRVAAVWQSGFSDRVRRYRSERGIDTAPSDPAVLVQRMIDADSAGVAFSADPVSGERGTRVVAAVHGLGTALVSGEADADTWHFGREGTLLRRTIARKFIEHRMDASASEGVSAREVAPSRQETAALTDDQAREIAGLAVRAQSRFGCPQDIEWAIAQGRVYLLQSRPITTMGPLADPHGERLIWDNSNIAESYSGITTPLTFSFARRAYEEVYRQFCRIMGVPESRIEAGARTFRNMLGLIQGRVFYNLTNWYRVLAMLPGFTINRTFMEQMMGVRESMPLELITELERASRSERIVDAWHLVRMVLLLVRNHFTIDARISAFYARLGEALGEPVPPLDQLRLDELASMYRGLERRLLTRWDAPLVNDFLAMIFYGILRKLAHAWCGDREESLQNDLLCGEGGMISAEPAPRVMALARLASGEPELIAILSEAPADRITAAVARWPAFRRKWEAYLEKFGDRCMEELKLESATLHDDCTTLARSIAGLAHRGIIASGGPAHPVADIRTAAEARASQALLGHPLRRIVFSWVLATARARVRDRENLRFERTRLFGRVRRIFVEIGRRLAADGRLAEPRDVFHLEVEEIMGFIEGTSTCTDLKALAKLRESGFAAFRDQPAPPDRFETCGAVHAGNRPQVSVPQSEGADSLKGIACCPGIVTAQVRVVTDPRGVQLNGGEILVAQRTDPGWIMLFPACAGLLVERGSLLSHSAVVARELCIPAIVSMPGLMHWLKDGDWVRMDGASGIAQKIPAPATAEA